LRTSFFVQNTPELRAIPAKDCSAPALNHDFLAGFDRAEQVVAEVPDIRGFHVTNTVAKIGCVKAAGLDVKP